MLLENDAEALATDDYGRSALHLAAGFGLDKIVALLLDKYPATGAGEGDEDAPDPISARDKYGWTPLHHACFGGHAEVAESLLARGSKPEKPNKVGQTSLHARRVGRDQAPVAAVLARMLRLAGATCHNAPKTPLDMAEARGYPVTPPSSEAKTQVLDNMLVHMRPRRTGDHRWTSARRITPSAHLSARRRDPPPENVNRLQVLLDKKRGILRSAEFSGVEMVSEVRPATMADVLRVHEYPYVRKIQRICERIPDWNTSPNGALGTIDGDTEVCHDSFTAALCARGGGGRADRGWLDRRRRCSAQFDLVGHDAGPTAPCRRLVIPLEAARTASAC